MINKAKTQQNFLSKLLGALWPIDRKELPKFLPVAGLMFAILFNQNILRILKDSIVIPEISAEITSFIKVYCVTPVAAIIVIIYAKMVNHLRFDKIFFYLQGFFISFFIVFALIIYPNIDLFHLDIDKANILMEQHQHFKWYIALGAYWSYVIFYVLAELWPNVFYVLLFWQLANEITSTDEAQRFYTHFSFIGNSSLIFVGLIMMSAASEKSFLAEYFVGTENKIALVQFCTILLAIFALVSAIFIKYLFKNIITDPKFYAKAKSERSTAEKLGLKDSFKYIVRSKYLWLMLICSASFGLTMNLVEAVWKDRIKQLYPTVSSYAEFNGMFIMWTGIVILFMTIAGNNIMRIHGWFVSAILTPIVILVTGAAFFILVLYDQKVVDLFDAFIVVSPLVMAVNIGAVQNILAKGTKFSIWDTSREMLYIPLDDELKTKGKAAVDVISSKVGKSSSGLIQSVIFTIVPTATYMSISPILMVVFIVVCFIWIFAVHKIYHEYKKII
jgi:ATP:ADP antiporter, AAA family